MEIVVIKIVVMKIVVMEIFVIKAYGGKKRSFFNECERIRSFLIYKRIPKRGTSFFCEVFIKRNHLLESAFITKTIELGTATV